MPFDPATFVASVRRLYATCDVFPGEITEAAVSAVHSALLSEMASSRQTTGAASTLIRRRAERIRSSELHLSPTYLSNNLDLPPLSVGDLSFGPPTVNWDGDEPYVLLRYATTVSARSLAIDVRVAITLSRLGESVWVSTIPSSIEYTFTPPFNSDDQIDALAIRQWLEGFVDAQRQFVGRPIIKTEPISHDPGGPSPVSIIVVNGLSVLLSQVNGGVLDRDARSNAHQLTFITDVRSIRAAMSKEIDGGTDEGDEGEWTVTKAGGVEVLDNPQRLRLRVHYHSHKFIGGDQGCNYFFCWDYREWVDAEDDIALDVVFSAIANGPAASLKAAVWNFAYDVPDSAIHVHGNVSGLYRDLIVPLVKLTVDSKVQSLAAGFDSAPTQVPTPFLREGSQAQASVPILHPGATGGSLEVNFDFT